MMQGCHREGDAPVFYYWELLLKELNKAHCELKSLKVS